MGKPIRPLCSEEKTKILGAGKSRQERGRLRSDFARRIRRRAKKANAAVSDEAEGLLAHYLELLWAWNRRMNLTALEDADLAVDRLVVEPLMVAKYIPRGSAIIDIGSGGGSPAIPLRIVVPDSSLQMVESKNRKCAFLREAVRSLELKRSHVEARRFEELLAHPGFHESADALSLRAVRVEPATLISLQAFVRPGGQILLFRGPGESVFGTVGPLTVESEEPLVESLRSRLVRLRKLR